MSELLPCPFCGDSSVKLKSEGYNDEHTGDSISYFVECLNCIARSDGVPTQEWARLAWNKRAEPKEQEAFKLGWSRCYQAMADAAAPKQEDA